MVDDATANIESLLGDLDEANEQNDWTQVKDLAEKILRLDPDNEDARSELRAVSRRLGRSQTAVTPTAEPLPESLVGGRYKVRKLLGEGSRKKVYLADDSTLEREVAFALIKTEGIDADARAGVLRQAQTMGQLGASPHIVSVYDMCDDDGTPYLILEYMAGGDLESLVSNNAETISLEQTIAIGRAICKGLHFAHQREVIHRDLKSANVWLADEGTAKIGDFGLALASGRSRITTENAIVGTVAYLSPEQATGGEVTARSDLYSLGCILYELVTGRPPYLGDDDVGIISQHINTPPVAPSWHAASCPEPLEALILRLLGKDPAQRPASAEEVDAALATLDLTSTPAADSTQHRSLDSIASGVFVGRQRELSQLKAILEEALGGHGRMVTLVGEPGIGKTRTAEALATYAGLRGMQVLWGRCYEEEGVPAYWPWIQAIRSYVRERDPESLRKEMGSRASVIAEMVSDVKERLPEIEAPVSLDDPESARFRLFDAVASFLVQASRSQPLMLVLDDLHWADKPSLQLLQFAARELERGRLLLVGTYRDVELNRRHPLLQTLAELTREQTFQRVLLRGLSEEDVTRFIKLAAGIEPPEGLTPTVFTHTEGNPLFVAEVVRLLVQEGELEPAKIVGRRRWSIRIPEGVREVIGRRLDRLSERAQEVITRAALLGRQFALGQLQVVVDDIGEERLLELLDELLAARIVEEPAAAVGTYQFTHALVQEALLQELSITRRARMHAQIAEALEGLYGQHASKHAEELVRHFESAETVLGAAKLIEYTLLAGEQALARHAYAEAARLFERGLESKADDPMDHERAALSFGLARATLEDAQRHERAIELLQEVFWYYVSAGNQASAVDVAAYPMAWRHYAGDIAKRALEMVDPGDAREGWLLWNASSYRFIASLDLADARSALDRAYEVGNVNSDRSLLLRTRLALASLDVVDGRKLEAQALVPPQEAVRLARGAGDLKTETMAIDHLLSRAVSLGKSALAEQAFVRLVEIERKIGQSVGSGRGAAFSMYVAQGRAAEAQQVLDSFPNYHDHVVGRQLVHALVFGDVDELRGRVDDYLGWWSVEQRGEFRPRWSHFPLQLPLAARMLETKVGLDEAVDAARSIIDLGEALPAMLRRRAHKGLGIATALQRDAEAAAVHYQALLDTPGPRDLHFFVIHDERVLGILAQAARWLDRSIAHFEAAHAFYARAGWSTELAWNYCDWAGVRLERNAAGDLDEAQSMLNDGLALAIEIGMPTLLVRLRSMQTQLDSAATAPAKPSYPAGLTRREVEVLRLVASGKIDKEVAAELFISAKTVGNHVSSILAKTGTANRTEPLASQFAAVWPLQPPLSREPSLPRTAYRASSVFRPR
jgi:DNA-binding CsgD family transcriptional regulator